MPLVQVRRAHTLQHENLGNKNGKRKKERQRCSWLIKEAGSTGVGKTPLVWSGLCCSSAIAGLRVWENIPVASWGPGPTL